MGWGTTFLMPSVLGRHIERDLGLPSEVVYGGITVMFGVGALFAPRVGRLLDRTGARSLMAIGSVVYALSLAALAFSQGLVSYLLCWAAMGVASTLALNTPASIALAQIAGSRARGRPSPCSPSSAASPRPCSGRSPRRSNSSSAGAACC